MVGCALQRGWLVSRVGLLAATEDVSSLLSVSKRRAGFVPAVGLVPLGCLSVLRVRCGPSQPRLSKLGALRQAGAHPQLPGPGHPAPSARPRVQQHMGLSGGQPWGWASVPAPAGTLQEQGHTSGLPEGPARPDLPAPAAPGSRDLVGISSGKRKAFLWGKAWGR